MGRLAFLWTILDIYVALSVCLFLFQANPSPFRFRFKSVTEPVMPKKDCGESPSLQELLPRATAQLASSFSNDDKEVLIYLLGYGRRVLLTMGAPSSVCKSPWKPWKSPSRASRREQTFISCTDSSAFVALAEDVQSKRSSWYLVKHKGSSSCDCFSCYSSFWRRWNLSPNRDLINEILDVVEEGPKSSKGKKKKKADKKRAALEAEACVGRPNGNVHNEIVPITGLSGLNEEELTTMQTSNDTSMSLDLNGNFSDGTLHTKISTDEAPDIVTQDEAPNIVTQTHRTGHKKSMFRVPKQKEEACVATLKSPDSRVNNASGATGIDNEGLSISSPDGDRENGMEVAVAIEVSENFTTETTEAISVGILSVGKSAPMLPRIGKRRHNQIMPLDCEGLLDVESEQEVAITVESMQASISPRAADIGLGSRGFLARVFPDALGRVASRLWDLVSGRLWSRTVEYH